MSEDRRNPYFILGIDYGASHDVARHAAGRIIRRVRRDPDALYGIEDVTWALHQVEQAIDNPACAINHYRVPADPTLFGEDGRVTITLSPTRFARATPPLASEDLESLRAQALDEVLESFILASAEYVDVSALFPAGKEESE